MRTSRVQGTSSSIYQNRRLTVQTDGAFQNLYEQGPGQSGQQSLLRDQKKNKQSSKKRPQLKTIKSRLVMKGMQLSADSMHMHNHLVRRAMTVNNANYLRTRNHTYRTSI